MSVAKSERALGEAPADRELGKADRGIEKQLDRIVAGLAMDLDQAREVRRVAIVEPIVIGEPGIRPRERDQLAGARVVEAEGALLGAIEHASHSGQRFDDRAAPRRPGPAFAT